MKIKIGIMQGRLVPREIKSRLQSFPWKNWEKEINFLKEEKIKYLEWTIDYRNFLNNPLIKKPYYVKKILKKNKVKVNSITADFFMQKPIYLDNVKTDEFLKKLIDCCKFVGIKYVIIPLVDNSSIKKDKTKEVKIIRYFKNLNNFLKKKNVEILFELDLPPKRVMKLIKKFTSRFGINYDTGNSAGNGYNFKFEKEYFKYVKNIHIKDKNLKGHSVNVSKGIYNFNKFFKHIKAINYKKNIILQTYIPKIKVRENTINNISKILKIYRNA